MVFTPAAIAVIPIVLAMIVMMAMTDKDGNWMMRMWVMWPVVVLAAILINNWAALACVAFIVWPPTIPLAEWWSKKMNRL